MAEIEKDAQGNVAANRPTGPGVVIPGSTDELIAQAPSPSDKAKKAYKVVYPTSNFVMEGMPVISDAGTPLTDEQAKKLLPVAEASGVKIVEVTE